MTQPVHFHTNLFGGFGAGFYTPPNTINFNTIFTGDFLSKLVNVAIVWGTVIAVLLLYFLLAVLCRRLDKKDAFKVC